jgi:hypothetical protein
MKDNYVPSDSNSDVKPVASHSCADGNSIEPLTDSEIIESVKRWYALFMGNDTPDRMIKDFKATLNIGGTAQEWRDIAKTNAEALEQAYKMIYELRLKEKDMWTAFGNFCDALK